jgi:rhodanese-related sulfurtransferase
MSWTVDPREVGDDLLLDVREQDEWDAGHVPGSVHVPLSEFLARVDEVPRDRPISVICKVGGRSAQVTAYLAQQGLPVRNVEGGLLAWVALGLPLEADSGAPFVL